MYREKVICTSSVVDKLITDLQEVSRGIDPFCIHVWTKALVSARPGEGLAPLGLTGKQHNLYEEIHDLSTQQQGTGPILVNFESLLL